MRNIKSETLTKCLSVLNEMKYIADNNIKLDPKNIASKHHTSEAIPTSAKKIGFFTTTGYSGKLICNKKHFDPIDARKVLNNIYDNQERKKIKTTLNITDNKSNTDRCNKTVIHDNENKNIICIDDRVNLINRHNIPPKFEEVEKYCNERQNDVNPAKFMSYYEQNGWMVGKNKMKNWKMAIHTWEQRNYNLINGKKLSDYSVKELIDELKRRGYTGIMEVKETISF